MPRTLEETKEYNHQYYLENQAKILTQKQEYYIRRKQEVTCECGKVLQKKSLRQHLSSKSHKKILETKK